MLELIIYLMILGAYFIGAWIIAMLIQGIVYWTSKFSIWNYVINKYVKGY